MADEEDMRTSEEMEKMVGERVKVLQQTVKKITGIKRFLQVTHPVVLRK